MAGKPAILPAFLEHLPPKDAAKCDILLVSCGNWARDLVHFKTMDIDLSPRDGDGLELFPAIYLGLGGYVLISRRLIDVDHRNPTTRARNRLQADSYWQLLAQGGFLEGELGELLLSLNSNVVNLAGHTRVGKTRVRKAIQRLLATNKHYMQDQGTPLSPNHPLRKATTIKFLTSRRIRTDEGEGRDAELDRIHLSQEEIERLGDSDRANPKKRETILGTYMCGNTYLLSARSINLEGRSIENTYSLEWALRSNTLILAEVFPEVARLLQDRIFPASLTIWVMGHDGSAAKLARPDMPEYEAKSREAHAKRCRAIFTQKVEDGEGWQIGNGVLINPPFRGTKPFYNNLIISHARVAFNPIIRALTNEPGWQDLANEDLVRAMEEFHRRKASYARYIQQQHKKWVDAGKPALCPKPSSLTDKVIDEFLDLPEPYRNTVFGPGRWPS